MIPIGDDDSGIRRFGIVTVILIAASVLVFLIELSQPDIEGFFQRWSVIPLEYAERTDLPPDIPFPFWFTLFSAMFMHGGWAHLIGNMVFLWIFGDNVEDATGHGRFLVFYLLCGIVATFAQVAIDPQSQVPNLGASGAIAGVLAAYLLLFPHQRVRVLLFRGIAELPAVAVIGLWIVFQFISGVGQIAQTEDTGGVAYAAHIGGFLAGLALIWLFRQRSSASRPA